MDSAEACEANNRMPKMARSSGSLLNKRINFIRFNRSSDRAMEMDDIETVSKGYDAGVTAMQYECWKTRTPDGKDCAFGTDLSKQDSRSEIRVSLLLL